MAARPARQDKQSLAKFQDRFALIPSVCIRIVYIMRAGRKVPFNRYRSDKMMIFSYFSQKIDFDILNINV